MGSCWWWVVGLFFVGGGSGVVVVGRVGSGSITFGAWIAQ